MRIESVEEAKTKRGRPYLRVFIEGDDREFSVWPNEIPKDGLHPGVHLEAQVQSRRFNGTVYHSLRNLVLKTESNHGQREESHGLDHRTRLMILSYAKDLTAAVVAKTDKTVEPKQATDLWQKYFQDGLRLVGDQQDDIPF